MRIICVYILVHDDEHKIHKGQYAKHPAQGCNIE